ncbi:MAG: elongation factor P, partial [Candidatus Jacksonbacteria bacterium]
LSKEKIKKQMNFLKEGTSVTLVEFEGNPIGIDLPPKVEFKVVETEPGVRGNTASGAPFKPAVLESGFKVDVPLFVKQNDVVRINTETGEYVERVS